MTSDQELRVMLQGTASFDPAFRVQVLSRICARARRRKSVMRAGFWIAATSLLGIFAQPLVPAESGIPAFESVVMTLSFVLAVVVVARPSGVRHWLRWAK